MKSPLRSIPATAKMIAVAVLICSQLSSAQTVKNLYVLQGGADGQWPNGPILDSGGNIYGDTQVGGSKSDGVIFELTGGSKPTILHNFNGKQGSQPYSALTRSDDGTLYGTTVYGDTYGTVFKIIGRNFTVVHSFVGNPDGAFPYSSLLRDEDGNIYGTTGLGGTGPCESGCGTVFRIDNAGQEAVLHSFTGPDGAYPSAGLIRDNAGNLYGTTGGGGSYNSCTGGCGTVFKMDRNRTVTVLHSFKGGKDGTNPSSAVFRDAHGNLYGTTVGGGLNNMGVVFEVPVAGNYRILHTFQGVPDGAVGAGPLAQAPNGDLYGVTDNGGTKCKEENSGCGTVYKIDAFGKYSVVYRFNGVTDGAGPQGSLWIDQQGNIYGSTVLGPWDGCPGFHGGCGTVWKLTVR